MSGSLNGAMRFRRAVWHVSASRVARIVFFVCNTSVVVIDGVSLDVDVLDGVRSLIIW